MAIVELNKMDNSDIKAAVSLTPPDVFDGCLFDDADSFLSKIQLDIAVPNELSSAINKQVSDVIAQLTKKSQDSTPQDTNQTTTFQFTSKGIPHPIDYLSAKQLKDISTHHSSCIATKVATAIGLGFISQGQEVQGLIDNPSASDQEVTGEIASLLSGEAYIKSAIDTHLDGLTFQGFAAELSKAVEDFIDGGQGYLEVVRDQRDKIIGINWMPVEDIFVFEMVENGKQWVFYTYYNGAFTDGGKRIFAPFGLDNRDAVLRLFYNSDEANKTKVSELILITQPSNRSKRYGYPKWLAAAPIIDLAKRAIQYKSDLFTNRGVLDYILSIAGHVDSDQWEKIVSFIQGTVGAGNNFKSMAIKTPQDSKIQVDKLASDAKTEEQFSKDMETFSQYIVTAHRVPPFLANILIPGKLGASNEVVQSLIAFQLLVAGPNQRIIEKALANTLGRPDDGIPELQPEDFRLRPITSQFNINGLDTVGRSREDATTTDRDFSEGVKE